MRDLNKKILEWADDKKLLNSDFKFKQFGKLLEETNELYNAIVDNNQDEIVDAFGDCVIVLTILAKQLDLDIDWCTEKAFSVIKNRTGKTIGGSFIKSEDL